MNKKINRLKTDLHFAQKSMLNARRTYDFNRDSENLYYKWRECEQNYYFHKQQLAEELIREDQEIAQDYCEEGEYLDPVYNHLNLLAPHK